MSNLITTADHEVARLVGICALIRTRPESAFMARFTDGPVVRQPEIVAPVEPEPVMMPEEPAIDPVDQARADAFAQGFDEGMRVATESYAIDDEIKARLAQALEQVAPVANGSLSTLLSATVLRLVEQIVGKVAVDPDMLATRVDAVAAFIEEEQGRNQLRLHPEDIALLGGHEFGIALTPDASVSRGSVRLDTSEGWIEDGPDVQLSRLRALLNTMDDHGADHGEGRK